MNHEQYEAARAIIQGDCKSIGEYLDVQGKTCVIGALARGAGVDDDTLRGGRSLFIAGDNPTGETENIREPVREKWGIPYEVQGELQAMNDSIMETKKRRAGCVAVLDRFVANTTDIRVGRTSEYLDKLIWAYSNKREGAW